MPLVPDESWLGIIWGSCGGWGQNRTGVNGVADHVDLYNFSKTNQQLTNTFSALKTLISLKANAL
jgi:hypothetical protein